MQFLIFLQVQSNKKRNNMKVRQLKKVFNNNFLMFWYKDAIRISKIELKESWLKSIKEINKNHYAMLKYEKTNWKRYGWK